MNTYHNWIKNDEKLQIIIFCKTTLNLFLIHILMLQYQNLFQHLTPTTMVTDILYLTLIFNHLKFLDIELIFFLMSWSLLLYIKNASNYCKNVSS